MNARLLIGMLAVLAATSAMRASGGEYEGIDCNEDFFEPPYEFYSIGGVEPADVELIMSMTEQQVLAAMPDQVPRIHTGCPDCHAHKDERNWMDHGERGQLRHIWYWDYNPLEPDKITCKLCGESYPGNKKYPQKTTQTFQTPLGEKIEVRSYFDPGKKDKSAGKKPKHYYMDGALDTAQWYWMRQQMLDLARLYMKTGEEKYAERSLLIFNAYCEVFPDFLMATGYGRDYSTPRSDGSWSRESTRSHRRGSGDGDWRHMDPTLEMLEDSEALKNSAKRFGMDLRKKHQQNVKAFIHNKWRCPPERIGKQPEPKKSADDWSMEVGQQSAPGISPDDRRNRNIPKIRHRIRNWELFPYLTYAVDGGYFEGLGYASIQYLDNMSMLDLNGYTDPADYEVPAGEKRYKNYHYPRGPFETFHRRMYSLPERLRMPDGYQVTGNDMGRGYTSSTFFTRDPRESSEHLNLPGMKHVMLGDGRGDEQVQLHVGFGHATHHSHADTPAIQLWAHGRYLLDDITYPKHALRAAYSSLLVHNAVVADGESHAARLTDGDVTLYQPNLPGLAAVKVDARRRYVGAMDTDARTLMLVTTDTAHPYVIDLYQVTGGRTKDYMLRAPTRFDFDVKYNIPLEAKMPKSKSMKDIKPFRHYQVFTGVKEGDASDGFMLTYDIKDPEDGVAAGLRHHFAGGENMTAYSTGLPQNSEAHGRTPWHECKQWPQLVLRHEGEDSVFVAVHEPYKGAPQITRVEFAKPYEPGDKFVALKIHLKDRVDRAIIALGDEPVDAAFDGMKMNGRIGFVAGTGDKADAYLIGGKHLSDRLTGVELGQPEPLYEGRITASFRKWDGDDFDGFVLEGGELPAAGDALEGEWVFISNHGELREVPDLVGIGREPFDTHHRNDTYDSPKKQKQKEFFFNESGIGVCAEIEKVVVRKDGTTYLYTKQDHGIEARNGYCREFFRPQREVFGAPTTFRIITDASTQGRPSVRPAGGAYMDPVTVQLATPADGGKVEYAFIPHDRDVPVGSERWQTGESVKLSETGELRVRSVSPRGIRTPFADVYEFSFKDSAAEVKVADLEPGLMRQTYVLEMADQATYDRLKAAGELDLPGRNLNRPFSGMFDMIYPDAKPFVGEYLNKVESVQEPQMRDFVQQYAFNGGYYGRLQFNGYIEAPRDGVYTLHYRPDHDGYLKLNGRLLCDYDGNIGEPVARVFKVALEKGLHELEFDYQVKRANFDRWYSFAEFEWEGPGMSRRPLCASKLYHDPALLAERAGHTRPLQDIEVPRNIEYAGRQLWDSREEALKTSRERRYINDDESYKGKVRQN